MPSGDDYRRALESFGLATAHILYHRPDHLWLLQEFIWQDYDLYPLFPSLRRFLRFWIRNLDGPLHSVTVAHSRLITPAEMRIARGEFVIH